MNLLEQLGAEVRRLRRNQRILTVAVVVFFLAHAVLIPLLPTLFKHALQASVGALVIGCVLLALLITRRAAP